MLIRTLEHLEQACEQLRAAGSFAMDTEFVRERNYTPRLGIVQVATPDFAAIIDPGAIGNLDALQRLLVDPAVEKIVHAGQGDFDIFYWRTGKPPQNVFDTQVAAAVLGYGDKISFQKLVEALTGQRLAKTETMTDWTRRPLTPEQIDYALDDVRPLPGMRATMGERLAALQRTEWAREEFRALEAAEAYERPEPFECWRRIRGHNLDGRALAVLRELAAWREQDALERDVPRGALAKDEVLVEMARRPPTKVGALQAIRYLSPRTIQESGPQIVAAVKRGLEAPPIEMPAVTTPRDEAAPPAVVNLLDALLRLRAQEASISPGVVAVRGDLEALIAARGAPALPDLPLLRGWRRQLVGEDLLALLAGQLRLSIDATTGGVKAERTT